MDNLRKIGILTLHYGINYGGVLQTYATQEILKSLNFQPIIIDRLPDAYSRMYPLRRKYAHPITQRSFYLFRKNELQPISRPIFSSEELTNLLKENFYGIVVGSDQVWRKEVFSVNGDYYLIHQQDLPIKKVAFAASTGVNYWQYNSKETKEIINALKKFNGISVREKESVSIFKENTGLDVINIQDPTLIANPEIYNRLCNKAKISGNGKLITYILDWTNEKRVIVEEASKKYKLQVQHILPIKKQRKNFIGRILKQDVTIYDWINQIATADFVVTDSFHGMVFSIIYNRQFIVIGNPERGMSRFTSLLSLLNIQDRLINNNLISIKESIDYSNVNVILSDLRKKGITFLKNSL